MSLGLKKSVASSKELAARSVIAGGFADNLSVIAGNWEREKRLPGAENLLWSMEAALVWAP